MRMAALLGLAAWLVFDPPLAGLTGGSGLIFRDVAAEAGLDFVHVNGATGEFYMPEIMGAGVALIDYDGDGDLDVYLVQGGPFGGATDGPGNRLFRNDLHVDEAGVPRLRFTEVTEQAGVGHTGYGMGVAVGDYNNDGHPDLYVTNFGSNVLYRNNGDGTFTDVTAEAGVDDPRWSTSAAFVDVDGDGHLDLFVTNYLDFTPAGNQTCYEPGGARDYCNPNVYRPVPDRLFRNNGDGTFTDVTERAGISRAFGPGLGVVGADFNGNGRADIFVANDGAANQLWINNGDGTFEESGLLSGTAYNAEGLPEASMGVAAGDFDNDGDEDLFLTHLRRETNTLYVNDGKGNFEDRTAQAGLGVPSIPYTGFGTEWFDYDHDGHLDLFVANGAVNMIPALRGDPFPFHEINQLFRNLGAGRFVETTGDAGPALSFSEVSRGAAFGDLDNDGDIDIIVTNNNGAVRVLLNELGSRQPWLQVQLERKQNLPVAGARLGLIRKGQQTLWRRSRADGSYLSANDPRVHFGLGSDPSIDAIEVRWPDGTLERWVDVQANRIVTVREGTGH
jgi:enediyne biosynthesis protein E4